MFCLPYPSVVSQRLGRASVVCIALALLLLSTAGVVQSAAAASEAEVLFKTKGCASCHVIPGVKGAAGRFGPSLEDLHKRKRIVGDTLENNPENLKAWLKNPRSIKSSTAMPNTGLTDEEAGILVEYFNSLWLTEAKVLLQAKACGACHVIPGVENAYGQFGPSLKGLHKRKRIVDGTLENNPENMKAWLKNPKSIKSGTLMPNTGLTDEEVDILIRYFEMI